MKRLQRQKKAFDINGLCLIIASNITQKENHINYAEKFKDMTFVADKGVTEIGARAPKDSNIEYIALPDSLCRIGEGAFAGTGDNIRLLMLRLESPQAIEDVY